MTNEQQEARRQKAMHAEDRSAWWLAEGNRHSERGNKAKAEVCYEKSARWLMRANDFRGW